MARTRLVLLAALIGSVATAQMGQGGGFPGGGRGGSPGGMGGIGGPRGGPRAMDPIKRSKFDKAVTAMFVLGDANRDGRITLDELQGLIAAKRDTLIRARFAQVDRDRNGSIDFAEFAAWQAELGSVALSDDAAGGRAARVASVIRAPVGSDPEDRLLAALIEPLGATVLLEADADTNGSVTLAELIAYEGKRFEAADKDKDGELSAVELRAARGGDNGFPDPRAFGRPGAN